MFRSFFFLLLALCFSLTDAFSQKQIKEYVINNTISFKAISPDSTNYADLEPIAKAIGDASVVMLGEEDHGDAPTFLFKTRLIKYLHEKKGFNVLAFESDFFGLNYGWDRLPKTKEQINSFEWQNIFPIWTACDACNTLFYNYIPKTYSTSNPLTITGFDSQQWLNFSYFNLAHLLDSTIRYHNLAVSRQPNYQWVIAMVDSSKKWMFKASKDTSRIAEYYSTLVNIKQQLAVIAGADSFWLPVVDGLIEETTSFRYRAATGRLSNYFRDNQMAQNLEWLIKNKFNGQKIIVWAHSSHLGRTVGNFRIDYYNSENNMNLGSRFAHDGNAGKQVYILGFSSFRGMTGRITLKQYNLPSPRSNSFERWINKDTAYAFTDFKKYNAANPQADEFFYMAGVSHIDIEAKWNHVFDGVVYIRDMYPCKRKDP